MSPAAPDNKRFPMKNSLALLAAFVVIAPLTADAAFTGGDFETPALATNSFQYNPIGGPLTFSSLSGIVNGSTAFNNPAPMGRQSAFLQRSSGVSGSITETFTAAAGLYNVSLLDATRGGFTQSSYTITVDGVVVGGDTPLNTNSLQAYSTSNFLLMGTTHTIVFTATGAGQSTDSTTFLDNVAVNPMAAVPEPGSMLMLGLGLIASGATVARKRLGNRASA